MTVKTDNKNRFNVSVTLPEVGFKTPNECGEFEHECESEVSELIKHLPEFYVVDAKLPTGDEDIEDDKEDLQEKSESDELGGAEENDIQGQHDDAAEAAALREVMIASLQEKKRDELRELCKPFPNSEWNALKKEELIQYLTNKL